MVHPKVDPTDNETIIAGALTRFCSETPACDPDTMRRFSRFVCRWLHEHLEPLSSQSDTSVRTWLEGTDYPEWRKKELFQTWTDCLNTKDLKHRKVKSFIKDEFYSQTKTARCINSRTDVFKCAVGPIFKLIEKELFKHEYFIKKISVADRPKFIYDMIYKNGAIYNATDYSKFEALFTKAMMYACEFQLYKYMTEELPDGPEWQELVFDTLGGVNHCEFKNLFVQVRAKRMSGEMCTSLGNSFTNLMATLFLAEEAGATSCVGVVEGDDGLFRIDGAELTESDYAKLGLIIKMEKHEKLSHASFCGLIFDEVELVNITDPGYVLSTFGWTSKQYARARTNKLKALLRCKSLSLAHQFPGCPVLGHLARYGLAVTRSINVETVLLHDRSMSGWHRDQLMDAIRNKDRIVFREPGMATRLLMEQKFGLTVEMQTRYETMLDSLERLGNLTQLNFPNLDMLVHPDVLSYSRDYVRAVDMRDDINRPTFDLKTSRIHPKWFNWYNHNLYTPEAQKDLDARFGKH